MPYTTDGETVTLTMSVEDWHWLVVMFGYVWAAAGEKDKYLQRSFMALCNRLNEGNPDLRLPQIPEEQTAHTP